MSKKVAINPYLVVLLKNMLAFEFVGMEYEPNNLQIAHFIYDRAKSDKYLNTKFTDPVSVRDSYAFGKAERIRKYLLTPLDFDFSIEHLDQFVEELTMFKKFSSWEEFSNEYSSSAGAVIARRNFFHVSYSKLDSDAKSQIRASVNRQLLNMYYYKVKFETDANQNIIQSGKDYTIRSANTKEIKEIERLAEMIYPCPINSSDVKKSWHEKNPLIFYVYKDDFGVWANINLLPIDKYLFNDLRTGKRYEDTINKSDLFTQAERNQVEYVYVEGLACTVNKILFLFLKNLHAMITSIANTNNVNLTICAIGGSKEGDKIMQKFGFKRTGSAIDKREKIKEYPFFEIPWKILEQNLNNNGFLRNYFNDDNRLTPLD